jgi:hypothetical protein
MPGLVKTLLGLGLLLILIACLIWLFQYLGFKSFPIGRLPGDIVIQKEGFTLYIPITTGILLSLLISGLLALFR